VKNIQSLLVVFLVFLLAIQIVGYAGGTCIIRAELSYRLDSSNQTLIVKYPLNKTVRIKGVVLPLTPSEPTAYDLEYHGKVEFQAEVNGHMVYWVSLHYTLKWNGTLLDLYYNSTTRLLLAASATENTILILTGYSIVPETCTTRTTSSTITNKPTTMTRSTNSSTGGEGGGGLSPPLILLAVAAIGLLAVLFYIFYENRSSRR
jgi:hypothetical protein